VVILKLRQGNNCQSRVIVSIRGDKIDFEPEPGDYVSVSGTVGFAHVGVWIRTLGLYISAYDVKRVRGF
jgi:hypothetical protein